MSLRDAHSIKLTLVKDSALFNNNLYGKSLRVTNMQNGKTVTVVVADECPTCQGGSGFVDFSLGAFDMLGEHSQGVLPISWEFV